MEKSIYEDMTQEILQNVNSRDASEPNAIIAQAIVEMIKMEINPPIIANSLFQHAVSSYLAILEMMPSVAQNELKAAIIALLTHTVETIKNHPQF